MTTAIVIADGVERRVGIRAAARGLLFIVIELADAEARGNDRRIDNAIGNSLSAASGRSLPMPLAKLHGQRSSLFSKRIHETYPYPAMSPIILEIALMNRTHVFFSVAVAVAGVTACGVAFAQAPAHSTPPPSVSSSAAQVETWTAQEWEAAKATWAQSTTKWAECQKQSGTRKLEGRESWSFLYTCMTS
jgi:hypothetical protein